MAVGYDPYFGMSGSSTNMGGGYYEDYLNRTGKTSYLQGGADYVEDPEYTENQKMQQEARLGLQSDGGGALPEFYTPTPDTGPVDPGRNPTPNPNPVETTTTPSPTPTFPVTSTAPPTETPGIPNLSDGIGAQLRQLFQQYMGGGQRNRNNYSNPMQQYRTAVTDTDEYKAYNDYASGLGPTEEQRAELQRLQSAFEGTDAYGQFTQQRQQRQNYMQPLGYGGGYGVI